MTRFREKLGEVLGLWSDEIPDEALLDQVEQLIRDYWPEGAEQSSEPAS